MKKEFQNSIIMANRLKKLLPFLMIMIVSCSSNKATTYMSLSRSELANILGKETSSVKANGDILSFARNNSGTEAFVTTVRECGVKPDPANYSVVRQLFVGFKKLRIIKQSKISKNEETILSLASAEFNNKSLGIISYSVNLKDCILDVVFWTTLTPIEANSDDHLIASLSHLGMKFEKVFDETLETIINRNIN
ncbi:MAG: hypothetical protein SGJ02_13025 [bacterium]|nr:hypothetical protein [bacterium]